LPLRHNRKLGKVIMGKGLEPIKLSSHVEDVQRGSVALVQAAFTRKSTNQIARSHCLAKIAARYTSQVFLRYAFRRSSASSMYIVRNLNILIGCPFKLPFLE